ncbi:YrhK family protein [Carnobacterium sp.]|uniref:YrhK family protein n=1 Tax=Carnobacterium sp. TaxID=48221 RepID=UPI003C78A778
MPEIKRTKHDINHGKEEDIEIKSGRFRLYFQNRYSLISLMTDFLTGIFYVIASISSLTSIPDIYGKYLYLIGGLLLTTRPILKIVHNIFIYDDKKIAERTKKKDKEKDDEEYNEDYYGKDNDKEYEKKEIQEKSRKD